MNGNQIERRTGEHESASPDTEVPVGVPSVLYNWNDRRIRFQHLKGDGPISVDSRTTRVGSDTPPLAIDGTVRTKRHNEEDFRL